MARNSRKKRDDAPSGTTPPSTSATGHNAKLRAETIRDVCRQLDALEADRDALTKEIRDLKNTRIKGDLSMKIADFDATRRLYKLEGPDRDTFFDALREGFAALGIGQQLDWIAAGSKQAAPAGPSADPAPLSSPHALPEGMDVTEGAGYTAGKLGRSATANPHPIGTPLHSLWAAGWQRGQGDLAAELGGDAA